MRDHSAPREGSEPSTYRLGGRIADACRLPVSWSVAVCLSAGYRSMSLVSASFGHVEGTRWPPDPELSARPRSRPTRPAHSADGGCPGWPLRVPVAVFHCCTRLSRRARIQCQHNVDIAGADASFVRPVRVVGSRRWPGLPLLPRSVLVGSIPMPWWSALVVSPGQAYPCVMAELRDYAQCGTAFDPQRCAMLSRCRHDRLSARVRPDAGSH